MFHSFSEISLLLTVQLFHCWRVQAPMKKTDMLPKTAPSE